MLMSVLSVSLIKVDEPDMYNHYTELYLSLFLVVQAL